MRICAEMEGRWASHWGLRRLVSKRAAPADTRSPGAPQVEWVLVDVMRRPEAR